MTVQIPKIKPLYLAIDQGGHASRALVFNPEGQIIAQGVQKIETQHPHPDWVEHDADALVTSLQAAIQEAVSQLGEQKSALRGAGLATQRSSIVCWHRKSLRPLSKVISWQDRRAADRMQGFACQAKVIHEKTGLFPSAHYGASKLRWCLDHLPSVQKAEAEGELCMGPLSSFLSARLTGTSQPVADPANAARTLLWNIKTGDWDPLLLEQFGVPLHVLPACVSSRHDFGHIAVSDLHIPLCIVTGDQSAALFQEGMPQKEATFINMGTGAFLQRSVGDRLTDATRLLSSVVFSENNAQQYVLEGTVNGAGAALSWFSKQRRESQPWPEAADAWLRNTTAPPLFINGVGGIGSPFWLPKIDSHFIGDGDPAAQFCGIIESILFLIQANLDEMDKILSPAKALVVSGGLSVSDPLCQKLANLSKVPVRRNTEPEASARGLAYLLGLQNQALAPQQGFKPLPASALQRRYGRWLKIMKGLSPDAENPPKRRQT